MAGINHQLDIAKVRGIQRLDGVLEGTVSRIKERGTSPKYPTGLEGLDDQIWGIHKKELITIGARPAEGKCHGRGTGILLHSGSVKRVEDILVGDKLMGDDSKPRKVSSVTSGVGKLYQIHQLKGEPYVVNEDHILCLKATESGVKQYGTKGTVIEISVRDYLSSKTKFKHTYKGYTVGVDFEYKVTGLDPYFLGIWLGDGTSSDTSITTMDKEIVTFLTTYASTFGLHISIREQKDNKSNIYCMVGKHGGQHKNPIRELLRKYKVWKNKHIPSLYKHNSKEVRLQLLAGLIDSDGYKNCKGYVFANKNKRLAYDVCYLARSLGFNSNVKPFINKQYNLTYYKVGISGYLYDVPIKIKHKQCAPGICRKNPTVHGIKIEYIGIGDYYGFTIDGNGKYLLDSFTVTHNTSFAMQIAWNIANSNSRALFLSLEMSKEQLVERLLSHVMEINNTELRRGVISEENDSKIEAFRKITEELPMLITDNIGYNMNEIEYLVANAEPAFDVVILDYIQLCQLGAFRNRVDAITEYLRMFKELCVRYDFAAVMLSQINRAATDRQDKRPRLQDLKGSGSLEEHSDTVALLYWPYNNEAQCSDASKYEVLIEKQRHGPIGRVELSFEPQYFKFTDNVGAPMPPELMEDD